jgi:hypothetical protein
MRDYEESHSRMMDNLDDLDYPIEANYDVNEWFPTDGSNDQDWIVVISQFRKRGTEASIRVPMMFKSHIWPTVR